MVLRIGLVGAGWWATRHHLPALMAHPEAQVTMVCDLDPARAGAVATTAGARACTDVAELVGQVDAVIVATPSSQHREPALAALAAGLPVLVEKPLATTAQDAFQLVRAAQSARLPFMVGHTHQFDEAADLARTAVREGVGDLLQVTAEFSSAAGALYADDSSPYAAAGGGHALTQLVHVLGMLCWCTGDQVIRVAGLVSRHGLAVDVDDAAAFVLGSGATGIAVGTGSTPVHASHHQQIRYTGTAGVVVHDLLRARTCWTRADGTLVVSEPDQHVPAYAAAEPARQFVRLVLHGGPNRGPARPAAAAVAAAAALVESADAEAFVSVPQLP